MKIPASQQCTPFSISTKVTLNSTLVPPLFHPYSILSIGILFTLRSLFLSALCVNSPYRNLLNSFLMSCDDTAALGRVFIDNVSSFGSLRSYKHAHLSVCVYFFVNVWLMVYLLSFSNRCV